MEISRPDRYSRYLTAAALIIALATYWRFREIDLSTVYAYVARHDVVRAALLTDLSSSRSILWDFFGLLNRFLTPGSIEFLRIAGLVITVLNFVLLSLMLGYVLGQWVWGTLLIFLLALSPPAIIAAVTGGPAAVAATLVILYLLALYRNQYIFGGLLAAAALAAGLPGLIMFLVVVLDLLQNTQDRARIIPKLLSASGAFLAVTVLIYFYSLYAGEAGLLTIPLGDHDLNWNLAGAVPLVLLGAFDIAGVVYLMVKNRFDVYKTHFHTFMLWVTFCALSVVQPTTLNLFCALVVSSVLAAFFLQGFASLWKWKYVSTGTFVFVVSLVFLFGDMYGSNKYLGDKISIETFEQDEAVDQVVKTIRTASGGARIVTNFAAAQFAVRLHKPVIEIHSAFLPIENFQDGGYGTIYIASNISKADTLLSGCKELFATTYTEDGRTLHLQVINCEETK